MSSPDQVDDLGYVLGGLRLDIGVEDTECLVAVGESCRHPLGQDLDALPGLDCGGDDLVLDVGDVADEGHLVTTPDQITADHVEGHGRAPMTDMWLALHRRPAHVDRDLPLVPGLERDDGAVKRAVETEHRRMLRQGADRHHSDHGQAFAPADEAQPVGGGRLHRDQVGSDTEGTGEVGPDLRPVRGDADLLDDDGHVDVFDLPTGIVSHDRWWTKEVDGVGTCNGGVFEGKCSPTSERTQRPEHGVGHRMGQDVPVRRRGDAK